MSFQAAVVMLLVIVPVLSLAAEGDARRPRAWKLTFDSADEFSRSFWAASGGEHARFESTPMGEFIARRADGGGTPPTVLVLDSSATGGEDGRPGISGNSADNTYRDYRVTVDWISPLEFTTLGVLLNLSDDATSGYCAEWTYVHNKHHFRLHDSTSTPLSFHLPESEVLVNETLSRHQPLAALRIITQVRRDGEALHIAVWMLNMSSGAEIGHFERRVVDTRPSQHGQVGIRLGVLGGLIGGLAVEPLDEPAKDKQKQTTQE